MSFPQPHHYGSSSGPSSYGNYGSYPQQPGAGQGPVGGEAASYYSEASSRSQSAGQYPQGSYPGQPEGERGLGTMAMGGLGGWAVNHATGHQHSNLASIGTGALLAQGGKMLYDHLSHGHNNNHHHGHHHHHQGHHHHGGGPGFNSGYGNGGAGMGGMGGMGGMLGGLMGRSQNVGGMNQGFGGTGPNGPPSHHHHHHHGGHHHHHRH